jgi:hypothetical protein
MSPAKVAAALLPTFLALVAVLVLTAGCGQSSQQSSSGSQSTSQQPSKSVVRHSATSCAPASAFGGANAQALPATFPRDFPTYPGAIFAAATQPTATRMTATWTTAGGRDAIRAFYETQLQSGDWQLFGEQYTDPCGAYWHFERRSNTHFGGLLSLYVDPSGGGSAFVTADVDKK